MPLWVLPFAPQVEAAPTVTTRPTPEVTSMNVNPTDEDLTVAAFGSDVVIRRAYSDGQWHWNRRWANVSANLGPNNGSWAVPLTPGWVSDTASIARNDVTYTRTSPGTAERFADLRFVAQGAGQYEYFDVSDNALTWKDREGNWIRYQLKPELPNTGVITEYGNPLYSHKLVTDDLGRVTEVIDHFDHSLVTFTYLDNTQLPTRIEDYSGRSVSYVYNDKRQLTEIVDVRGESWRYTYTQSANSKPKIASITDPRGNTTHYEYTNNQIIKTDADGLDTVYTYRYDHGTDKTIRTEETPDGTLHKIVKDNTQKFGATPKYQKFINGELISQRFGDQQDYEIENQAGERTRYQKNAFGKLERVIHPDQTEERWEYSADGRDKTAYVNRLGVRTEWDYDSYGRVIELREAAGLPEQRSVRYAYPDTLSRVTTQLGDQYTSDLVTAEEYDQYGNLKNYTDAEDNQTSYTHNSRGQVITVIKPSGAIYGYQYDARGNLTTKTIPTGNADRITHYDYDPVGNLKAVTWPNDAVINFRYDQLNQRISLIDELDHVTKVVYDRTTRTFRFEYARNVVTTLRLDARGRPSYAEDPNGNTTRQSYERGQLVSTQYPTFERYFEYAPASHVKTVVDHYGGKQSKLRLQLNPYGQLNELIDANNNDEHREYDGLGQLVRITDANGGVTKLTYDVHGNLIEVTDPEGRSTWFEYNGNGQVVSEIRRPTPGEVNQRFYEYDSVGNLIAEKKPEGEEIFYDYDYAGQLTKVTFYSDVTTRKPEKVIQIRYNKLGQIIFYDDGETSGNYSYDPSGNLLNLAINYGPFSKSISYSYDDAGNIESYTNPEKVTYRYSYNANRKIESISIPDYGLVNYSDYVWNQPTKIQLPGGTFIRRQYDGFQRMSRNSLLDPAGNSLMGVVYGYDAVGNIYEQSTDEGVYKYQYDSLYRLTSANYPKSKTESYTYDDVGNRTSYNQDVSFQYNGANQLKSKGEVLYNYNDNGQLIEKKVEGEIIYYLYNSQDRLVRVERGSGAIVASYGYDPFGHRLWKEVAGRRTYYFYNPSGLVGEYGETGGLIKEYHYKPGSPWMTEPVFQREESGLYFYQTDHLGTPKKMVSVSGQVVWEMELLSFGEVGYVKGVIDSGLRFPGQYHDNETGLYYNYNRYYDPEIGRYIQSDPVGLKGGINQYLYAYQNPLINDDPHGLFVNLGGAIAGALCELLQGKSGCHVFWGFVSGAVMWPASMWVDQFKEQYCNNEDNKDICRKIRNSASTAVSSAAGNFTSGHGETAGSNMASAAARRKAERYQRAAKNAKGGPYNDPEVKSRNQRYFQDKASHHRSRASFNGKVGGAIGGGIVGCFTGIVGGLLF